MASEVARALEDLQSRTHYGADGDLVFRHPHTGRYYVASILLERFKATLRQAHVRRVRFDDLRHTFATQAAAADVPMRTLQEWMGHADIQTTLIYADYAPDAIDGRELLDRAFSPQGR
jgi:integrase